MLCRCVCCPVRPADRCIDGHGNACILYEDVFRHPGKCPEHVQISGSSRKVSELDKTDGPKPVFRQKNEQHGQDGPPIRRQGQGRSQDSYSY